MQKTQPDDKKGLDELVHKARMVARLEHEERWKLWCVSCCHGSSCVRTLGEVPTGCIGQQGYWDTLRQCKLPPIINALP